MIERGGWEKIFLRISITGRLTGFEVSFEEKKAEHWNSISDSLFGILKKTCGLIDGILFEGLYANNNTRVDMLSF